MSRRFLAAMAGMACISIAPTWAKEGMYTPEQLPMIQQELRDAGIAISPQTLTNLSGFPMGAVVSLGGCSASFVSPKGLVLTNHHCVRGSLQYNTDEQNNYLEAGFLARQIGDELPAAPGTHVYVTVDFRDVTPQIVAAIPPMAGGLERFEAIDMASKNMISDCEAEAGYRCDVKSFYGGKEYKLIKQLEIRDVRIAYAPSDAIGRFGGDEDNWMWPRHTGDFAFYRAYVGPDGKPADFSENNVPYNPAHYLEVAVNDLEDNDFVMVAGYPGKTNRYARAVAVEHVFDWLYPTYLSLVSDWIKTIETAAPAKSEKRVKYASLVNSLSNFLKNTQGQLNGAKRAHLVENRRLAEQQLNDWLMLSPANRQYAAPIRALDALAREQAQIQKQNFWYTNITRAQLLSAAQLIYRFAVEKEKPDAQRARGFQERDRTRLEQRLTRIDRRFDTDVDSAVWQMFINEYRRQPEQQHVAAFDDALSLNLLQTDEAVKAAVARFYSRTQLDNLDTRLQLMAASREALEQSQDPFMQLAVALHATEMRLEDQQKQIKGDIDAIQPDYMKGVLAWKASQGQLAYPDANGTLRVTYGKVKGGSPRDGLIYEPFTRLGGIAEKHTGMSPFNAPAALLDKIATADAGTYSSPVLGTVPVNFLTDTDSTGGNSGSPTLNDKGQLVGILFDGTFESVNSDWNFNAKATRSIHVDARYMLWLMQQVDNASYLVDEMTVVPAQH